MRNILPFLVVALATPAGAAEPVRLIVSGTHVEPSTGRVTVDLVAINASGAAADFTAPAEIAGSLKSANGRSDTITLRPATSPDRRSIATSGFVPLRYEGDLPVDTGPGMLSLAVPDAPIIALDIPAGSPAAEPVQVATATTGTPPAPPVASASAAPPSAGSPRDNPLLPNLSVYEPIYFVYGPGTNTAARIQISLKYRLFGQRGNWMDGINFAYTQRMFWDIGGVSSPFRDVNYMPELFYLVPPRPVGTNGLSIGGRFGARHESNGRDGLASRTLNTLYVQPEASLPIGRYTLTLGPRVWAYVGGQAGNEDIERYRGHTGLYAAFGEDDGLRLSMTSRFAFGSGKGAVDGTLSYPLTRAWASGPQLYVIAQGFAGYGESLLDYNRKQTRLRIGFGITR